MLLLINIQLILRCLISVSPLMKTNALTIPQDNTKSTSNINVYTSHLDRRAGRACARPDMPKPLQSNSNPKRWEILYKRVRRCTFDYMPPLVIKELEWDESEVKCSTKAELDSIELVKNDNDEARSGAALWRECVLKTRDELEMKENRNLFPIQKKPLLDLEDVEDVEYSSNTVKTDPDTLSDGRTNSVKENKDDPALKQLLYLTYSSEWEVFDKESDPNRSKKKKENAIKRFFKSLGTKVRKARDRVLNGKATDFSLATEPIEALLTKTGQVPKDIR